MSRSSSNIGLLVGTVTGVGVSGGGAGAGAVGGLSTGITWLTELFDAMLLDARVTDDGSGEVGVWRG